jgi:hypothetical protein
MADMNIAEDTKYDIGSMPKKRQIMSNKEEVCGEVNV